MVCLGHGWRWVWLAAWASSALAQAGAPKNPGAEPGSVLSDPFVQATGGLAGCPVPQAPHYSAQEVRQREHERTQHGTSCYLSGRCRLPNSYLYDAEIIPRVRQFIALDGRFDDTSVWVLGQRRTVTLLGCVQSTAQACALQQAVGLVDDVVGVVNQLQVPQQAGWGPFVRCP